MSLQLDRVYSFIHKTNNQSHDSKIGTNDTIQQLYSSTVTEYSVLCFNIHFHTAVVLLLLVWHLHLTSLSSTHKHCHTHHMLLLRYKEVAADHTVALVGTEELHTWVVLHIVVAGTQVFVACLEHLPNNK